MIGYALCNSVLRHDMLRSVNDLWNALKSCDLRYFRRNAKTPLAHNLWDALESFDHQDISAEMIDIHMHTNSGLGSHIPIVAVVDGVDGRSALVENSRWRKFKRFLCGFGRSPANLVGQGGIYA
jgi:hypothetical protein